MSRYPIFDRSQIRLQPLCQRGHDLVPENCWELNRPEELYSHPEFAELLASLRLASKQGRPIVLMMGAHLIKLGLSRFVIDLMDQGLVTHVATNGAGIIHDFEIAWGQGTSESVPKWIRVGQFGLWKETSLLNDFITEGARRNEGLGESVGRAICEFELPRQDLSIAAAGWRNRVPVTCHVSVGSDIIHSHANCDGAALGQTSYTDFLMFARTIQDLEGGVFLNVGSAVTGPEVYLKALSMARNIKRQHGEPLQHFTTAVFDLCELPASFRQGPPGKDHPMYYYRPWKTILVRTVADGGSSYYFQGDHQQTIPSLWWQLTTKRQQESDLERSAA